MTGILPSEVTEKAALISNESGIPALAALEARVALLEERMEQLMALLNRIELRHYRQLLYWAICEQP